MKNLYTIGETAEIMGLSVQTLRNYSNMGLLTPEYIDEKTGYRYYSFDQLHFIDKILYFRELGVPLSEIKKAIELDSSEKIVELLKAQRDQLECIISKAQASSDNLDWYIHYFEYPKKLKNLGVPYIVHKPKRYAIGLDCGHADPVSQVETELARLRHSAEGMKFSYLRQYGYVIDFNELTKGIFMPLNHFMYISDIPRGISDEIRKKILEFPEGEYMCFFDTKKLSKNFIPSLSDITASSLVLASEYEETLSDYGFNSYFEFEIYLGGS